MNQFYYVDKGKQLGPVSIEDLQKKIQSKEIDSETKVWREGMNDWVEFSKLNDATPSQSPQDKEVDNKQETVEPKILKSLLFGSIFSCVVFLLNPFAGFALVYALQAKNAFKDGRLEDMTDKISLCKKMLIIAVIVSCLIYTTAVVLYKGLIPLPEGLSF